MQPCCLLIGDFGQGFVGVTSTGKARLRNKAYAKRFALSRGKYVDFDRMSRMAKNKAAVALGSRGGKARSRNLTPEQRRESARKAAQARWAKAKKKPRDRKTDVR